jgi:hypothetical protein
MGMNAHRKGEQFREFCPILVVVVDLNKFIVVVPFLSLVDRATAKV